MRRADQGRDAHPRRGHGRPRLAVLREEAPPLSSKASQEILIVGGGIGGVASALALARRGIPSRVLEKAPEFGEIGYGIQQGPNAYRMLDWQGVMKDVEAPGVSTGNVIVLDAVTVTELT